MIFVLPFIFGISSSLALILMYLNYKEQENWRRYFEECENINIPPMDPSLFPTKDKK